MEKRIKNNLPFLFLLLFIFSSCNKGQVYNKSYDFEKSEWAQEDILSYSFTIEDSLNPHHVLFNVRHTSNYKYKNLYLFVETTSPEGISLKDTFQIMLADDKGRWHGDGWGDIYEMTTPYRKFVRFPKTGTYNMEVQQAMRTQKLEHITDFGVKIVKAKTREK